MNRYGLPAIALHWLMALIIIAGFVIGQIMVDMRFSPTKLQLVSYHKWLGITVFLLALLRLAWRWSHPPPAPLPGQPRWQVRLAAVAHAMLYLLMLVIPLTGWLYSSAAGVPTVYLGVVPLPDLIERGAEAKDLLKSVHAALNRVLLVLVVGHVLAALKHALIDRDETLARMLPGRRRGGSTPNPST
jgi:cytochrome b561